MTRRSNNRRTPDTTLTFEGLNVVTASSFGAPPDPIGDVGRNYYVQGVNSAFSVYSKSTGAQVMAPKQIAQLWIDAGAPNNDPCRDNDVTDTVIHYDQYADRWLVAQIATPFFDEKMCIAISQTSDPTGSYFVYTFPWSDFPDYPKFGVWPDAYYMGTNETSYLAWAFERDSMLVGANASAVGLGAEPNFVLPADADGASMPSASSPGIFYTFTDDDFHSQSADSLLIYEFDVDFATPANSTFERVQGIEATAFNYTVCGFFSLDCIPQKGTGSKLDPVSEWPMHRFQYRRFGSHESLVGNFTIDVTGSNLAGIRWFELRRVAPMAPWTLHQESTHSPDGNHRWMGSVAMDGEGNIALAYSESSNSLNPALSYASRFASDASGTLRSEKILKQGTGSQTGSGSRWGDYSSLNVDPVDDKTFWYTGEWYETTTSYDWKTHIGKFKVVEEVTVEAYVYLEGPYGATEMRTTLEQTAGVPLEHPFSGAPWSFAGPDSARSIPGSTVDWVLLSLVSGDPLSPPMRLAQRRAGLLQSDGSIVDTSGTGAVIFEASPDSSYYLVVEARNHLSIMSSSPLTIANDSAAWDFRSAEANAYAGAEGTAVVPLPGSKFGMFGCDIDADGELAIDDFADWLAEAKVAAMGYLATDCDFDGETAIDDYAIWLRNAKSARESEVPAF